MPAAPEARSDRLVEAVDEAGLDALIVGDLVRPGDSSREAIADLTWLTGFDGTSGLAVVGERLRLFVTDFRYLERARRQRPSRCPALRRSPAPAPSAPVPRSPRSAQPWRPGPPRSAR